MNKLLAFIVIVAIVATLCFVGAGHVYADGALD
jgi:hypothetical protein